MYDGNTYAVQLVGNLNSFQDNAFIKTRIGMYPCQVLCVLLHGLNVIHDFGSPKSAISSYTDVLRTIC